MTILYSILHMFVDGICAFAMFGRFLPQGNASIDLMLYNFCAFALQMPFGVMLDYLEMRSAAKSDSKAYSYFVAAAGVLFTILGTATHPVLLGIGNALFHIGGGVGTIHEDNARNRKGSGLGVFVAPGALGLYIGSLAASSEAGSNVSWILYILMALICAAGAMMQHNGRMGKVNISTAQNSENTTWGGRLCLLICCLLVVVLRSYIGMAVTFPWKMTFFSGLAAVFAIVAGKMAGGFLAAKYGIWRTCVFSMAMAAVAYIGSSVMPLGVAALLLFNMTMPITLYLLICQFPQMPGFSFGLLTFGLFLGFLPEYFGLPLMAEGNIIGGVGSILSLFILLAGMYCCKTYNDSSEKGTAKRRLY